MSFYKAIVIGSGVAGIASAIRLSLQGFQVTVFEKNNYPGGKLTSFSESGYHFDAGPSLFIQPSNIEELFSLAGEPVEEYFNYRKVPVACKYFYEDGTVLNAYADKEKFAEELNSKLSENKTTVETYLATAEKLYRDVGEIFLNYSLHKAGTLWNAPLAKAIAAVKTKHLFRTLNQVNKNSFNHEHTVQLFNRYATYNGSNPFKAPGMLSLIPHPEYNEGVFYPEGGMINITNALYQLALKKNVVFHFNAPVQRIVHEKGKVDGVMVNNKKIDADVVVSNMDVYFTYRHLLSDDNKASQLLKQERSSSALIFYWGIGKEFPELDLHNIFFSADYKTEFDYLFNKKALYHDPTVYINITSKYEPGKHAPEEKENWFVMINAPANCGQDWKLAKQQAKKNIIEKLNRLLHTDIASLIEVEQLLDPVTIEDRTSSYMGALYGTSSNSRNAAFLRHPNFSKHIKGLYFAGGSVHPGGGIPLCLKSAKIVSDIVASDTKKWKH